MGKRSGVREREERGRATGARAAGIVDGYIDGLGVKRRAPAGAVEALLEALGEERASAAEVVIARAGKRVVERTGIDGGLKGWSGRVDLEDGGTLEVGRIDGESVSLTGALPLGVHRLVMKRGHAERVSYVLATPSKLEPDKRLGGKRLGVFIPLYAVASKGGAGVGTLTDLGELVEWARSAVNGFVGTLPLFPSFLDRPFDPSPYAPVSRLFWNELFVDVRRSPEWEAPVVRRVAGSEGVRAEMAACRRGRFVDYRRSWRVMRRLLGAMAGAARRREQRWDEVQRLAGGDARGYAHFRAAADATGNGWPGWSASWRRGRIPIGEIDERAADVYVYAQALANAQMESIAAGGTGGSPLYLDLPVGVHADGYDVWRRPELFLRGVSAGAPPDGLHAGGQVWGFPPMHPTSGRADGYAHLRLILRRMLRVAGVLRIDHVMWLERMYCVMPGFGGDEGAYLRYPVEELMAVVMIEAARAGAVVVGEDLGTVTDTMRRRMRRCGVLGMHVQQFSVSAEPGAAIGEPPPHSLASLNTHDTPTFAGYWTGGDIDLRVRLGHVTSAPAKEERAGRARVRKAVGIDLKKRGLANGSSERTAMSLMRMQARSGAPITLVNLEDLWGEASPQNVPGTSEEHPNWRRRSGRTAAGIAKDKGVNRALRTLAQERLHGRVETSGGRR